MSKKIYCQKCGKYLGEIRDATLRKGVIYVCMVCNSRQSKEGADLFDRLFGTPRGRG